MRDHEAQLLPMCLPAKMPFPTYDRQAYTAGWGKTYRPECLTDNRGPVRNVKCRFPYDFAQLGYLEERTECSHDHSPSKWNPRCGQFVHNHPDFDWTTVAHVEIRYSSTE